METLKPTLDFYIWSILISLAFFAIVYFLFRLTWRSRKGKVKELLP